MMRWPETQQVIYEILLTQIESGTYRYLESLPTIEEASGQFHVSVDTVRAVYLRLKQEGVISLTKNVGAKVIVERNEQETDEHIQRFFSLRKDALIDLGKAVRPLFGNAQWTGLKYASADTLARMEQVVDMTGKRQAPCTFWQYLEEKYLALGNRLLIRLTWQVYLFFYATFFSVAQNVRHLDAYKNQVQDIISLCRQEDWAALRELLDSFQAELCTALLEFYDEKISMPPPRESIAFRWDSYPKSSQLCYSLTMELLISINRGVYPVESYLPTAEQLAKEKGVSVSTVRRAVSLLGSIGAVRSSRPFGARVLPFSQGVEHCDFTRPVLQRRLLDMVQSLQIFALSCRAVSALTLASLDAGTVRQWREELTVIQKQRRYEVLDFSVLSLIARSAPYQAICTVYSELLRQLFWGNPLRGMKGDQASIESVYEPYFSGLCSSLEGPDIPAFSATLEALLNHELRVITGYLVRLGIPGADGILIPGEIEESGCVG